MVFGGTRSPAAGAAAPLSFGEERTAVRQGHGQHRAPRAPWPDYQGAGPRPRKSERRKVYSVVPWGYFGLGANYSSMPR
jgi:hypothetical protein